jgi:hypothetical protein
MKYTNRCSGLFRSAATQRCGAQDNPARPPGIEGVKMQDFYYNQMRTNTIFIPQLFALLVLVPLASLDQHPLKAASLESHEGVTISVLPWTEAAQYKEKFPKKSPLSAGVLAVQVTFRNDTDDSIKINLERIRLLVTFSDNDRQQIEPLSSSGLADAVLHPSAQDPTATRRRFPIPHGGSNGRHDKNWTEIEKAARDAGPPGSIVAPHGALQGLLYFDLQGQFDLLATAHLYLPELQVLEKNRSLTYFEIELSRVGEH